MGTLMQVTIQLSVLIAVVGIGIYIILTKLDRIINLLEGKKGEE